MRLTSTLLALSMIATPALAADDPLLRPIEPEYAKRFLIPAPPVHVFGNTSLVGFGGVNVAVIATKAGLILIDGALPQGVRDVEEHLRTLGLNIRDVKLILSTEPHYDHAGGLAALERDSGATIVASAAAAGTLRAGGVDPTDPQAPLLARFPAPRRIRVVRDAEVVRLGEVAVTALALPGHTPGSMGWRWTTCDGGHCAHVVFSASINAVSADGYRFTDHPALVSAFRASIARLRALPCDVVLTSHLDNSDGDKKLAAALRAPAPGTAPVPAPNPWLDSDGCRKAAAGFQDRLNARLAKEAPPR